MVKQANVNIALWDEQRSECWRAALNQNSYQNRHHTFLDL